MFIVLLAKFRISFISTLRIPEIINYILNNVFYDINTAGTANYELNLLP